MASNLNVLTNLDRARIAWGADMPRWVRLLATACDATSQRIVADRLDRSGGYVSRLINRNYAGSYDEAETLVRGAYGDEEVDCPLWGPIPLSSCIRNRRRKGPPQNQPQRLHAATCPACPNNTDRAAVHEEE